MGTTSPRPTEETSGATGKKARIFDRPPGWTRFKWPIVITVIVIIAILVAMALGIWP